MKWRSRIYLALISLFLTVSLLKCHCSDDAAGDNGDESVETIRVDNGFADRYPGDILKIKRCNRDFADCDKDVANGCETNIKTDRNNCGFCGNVCLNPANTALVECLNSTCQIDYCTSGYVDLDGKYENGCEYKCIWRSEKEIEQNLQDDDCDGFIDNICTYTIDPNDYPVASDLRGRVDNLVSTAVHDYTVVAYQVLLADASLNLNMAILDSQNRVVSSVNVKNISSGIDIGGITLLIYNNSVALFWSENEGNISRIFQKSFDLNGIAISTEKAIFEHNSDIDNLIVAEYKSSLYLSFESVEKERRSVLLLNLDPKNLEVKFKRIISTADLDCYGHNIYFLNDIAFVSYWEMKGNSSELVVMKNDLIAVKKERSLIHKTVSNPGGTAIDYGNGYFVIMWTEQVTSLGSLYMTIMNEYMESILLERIDLNYDEFGLPVTSYNGNIFGSTFITVKDNRYYILFSNFDISGAKIQELIISPVSIINKPYLSSRGDDFFIFYSNLVAEMEYSLNMKRVYCIKN